jgi:hypothetical protein
MRRDLILWSFRRQTCSLGHSGTLGSRAGAEVTASPWLPFMLSSNDEERDMADKQKIRGRPATGVTPMLGFRASDKLRGEIMRWANYQPDTPKLSEAVRRLVEIGLASGFSPPRAPRVPSTSKQGATRAAELAGRAIDKRIDPTAPAEEREVRNKDPARSEKLGRIGRKVLA